MQLPLTTVVLSAAMLLAAPALAQEEPRDLSPEQIERARGHFMAGRAYYEDGRWQDAAREFQESYRITAHPDVLYNLGQAYDQGDERDRAIEAYRGYLDQRMDAPDRERVERRIRELEQLHAAVEAEAASAPEPRLPAERGPEPRLEPVEEPASVLPWIVIAAGGALAAGAAVTGVMALSTHSDLEDACGGGPCPADRQDDVDRGEALATWSTVLTVAAVLAVAAGVTLLVLSGSGGDDAPPVATVELLPGPSLAGAGARIRF